MIYLDNAATTFKKPQAVVQAVTAALTAGGSSGRGAHTAALEASRTVYKARELLAQLFNAESPQCIAFTHNATHSLNTAIKGIIKEGDHVITTQLEHNSVLRPLYEMEKMGAQLTIVPCSKRGTIDYSHIENSIKPNTKAIVVTHASNVTGNVVDVKAVGKIAERHGVLFVVDASQTAGVLDIDVQEMKTDILCFTGHKALLGPQGTGGIYVKKGVELSPLLTGGSGVQSHSKTHPLQMPTALEAGTLNTHGIAGLAAAVEYILQTGRENIQQREAQLAQLFYSGVKDIEGVTLYGDFKGERCAVVSLNIRDYDSAQVSDVLCESYGIATRAGAHCAPLMHLALGTENRGAVRFSFSHYNTEQEVQAAIEAVKEIAKA